MDYDDVYQDLAIRLIRCVENFDPDKGTLHAHINSQLKYELLNCKAPRKLTDDFEQMKDFEGKDIKNARNLAAGSIRLLDSAICKDRCIYFYAL